MDQKIEVIIDTLGVDIVKNFHEQFAQNQNHHQRLFLQIITVLLTVLIGFGYIYIRVDAKTTNLLNVTLNTLYMFLCLSTWLLSLSTALISNMALGFRRDQLVACVIRVKAKVMNTKDNNNFFPSTFIPLKNKEKNEWMPEFHFLFFWAMVIIKSLLIFSVIGNPTFTVIFNLKRSNCFIIICVFVSLLSFAFDYYINNKYYEKWCQYIRSSPEILQK